MIKVELPGAGDFARECARSALGEASYFVWLNRGKESTELDIKDTADRSVLDRERAVINREVICRPERSEQARPVRNTDRVRNGDEITLMLERGFRSMSAENAEWLLETMSIASARFRTPAEFYHHPRLSARDKWPTVELSVGSIQVLLPPVTAAGREPAMGAVPSLGAHNAPLSVEIAPTQEAML